MAGSEKPISAGHLDINPSPPTGLRYPVQPHPPSRARATTPSGAGGGQMAAMTVASQYLATAGGVSGATLVAGATGYIGKFVAEATLAAGFPTYVLHRPAPAAGPGKEAALRDLREQGAVVVEASASDKEAMERTLRELGIEVVISVLGGPNLLDQLSLIEAAKAAGTVKRFLPSEFGNDVGRADPVEPGRRVYEEKRRVRRAVEAAAMPYTYICCNSIAGWPYHDLHRTAEAAPPLECLPIYGDGDVKAYFVAGCDIGKFTVMAAHDPRALNKAVHFQPPCNFLTMNELASLWEEKIGRSIPRVTITEDELVAIAAVHRIPQSFIASFTHEVYIKGCQHRFAMDRLSDVEVTELYPGVPFQTMDECFEKFAAGVLAEKVNGGNPENRSRLPGKDLLSSVYAARV